MSGKREAAHESRFVVIDGVQISRARAIQKGLIAAPKKQATEDPTGPQAAVVDGPPSSRARGPVTARRAGVKGPGAEPEPATGAEPADVTE